jgi:hypothetical protein
MWSVLTIFVRPKAQHIAPVSGRRGGTMAAAKNAKEYARYAAHCLTMVPSTAEPDVRAIQREMAAEWLRLADAVLRPFKRTT